MVPCKKFKMVPFTSSRIKNNAVFPACPTFPGKLLYCLLKPISKKIFCVWYAVLCCCFFFQTVKQKAYLLHENLDQLSNLNIGFMSPLYLFHLTDSYSS